MTRKILVTSALPYANGPIHLGHLVEYIQTDIWVRFQRMQGNQCYYVCADDAHGTPIMLRARKDGIPPEELIQRYKREHETDFADFDIQFDNYHTTHSEENRECSEFIYEKLKSGGYISRKVIRQAYDPEENLFLPDRFVKGQCPRCHAEDQYGDSCEVCGATYSPADLINPVSALSGITPEQRESEHLFVRLGEFTDLLQNWVSGDAVQPESRNKLKEWFDAGLQDWDISRDAPYFGFRIPNEEEKYFYVWLDAPIGYMASFKNLCNRESIDFDSFWLDDSDAELYHFIGKDILYFHTLFWPAMLRAAGFRMPTGVFAHGFLTVDGQKMSKSRGTFITAREYLNHLSPEYLRYYYAFKLNERLEDIDLNLEDFVQRVNSDLVGKVVNIASRTARFITTKFDGQLGPEMDDEALYLELVAARESIAQAYEQRAYSKAMREIMSLADKTNAYINDAKPWEIVKDADARTQLHKVCTQALNSFRLLIFYLAPAVPSLAQRVGKFLNEPIENWNQIEKPLLNHKISDYSNLLGRIQMKDVVAIVEASKQSDSQPVKESAKETISIDELSKVDLRVGRVLEANEVEDSRKLLKLKVDIGGETRQIFAGIKGDYNAEKLVGHNVVIVANLKPRKMKFGTSEGMVLAASDDSGLSVVTTDRVVTPGAEVS